MTLRHSRLALLRAACLAVIAITSISVTPARAQDENAPLAQTLAVGIYIHPPFVMNENGPVTGMAVELWEWLADQLALESEYVEFNSINELVDAAQAGVIDVGLTNLTITRGRAERVDFTHPWFDAGQRIMINEDRGAGFQDVVAGLRASGHLRAYLWIAFVVLVATVLLTLFDRHFDRAAPHRWRDGIAESFYTVMSVVTSGKPPARRNLFGWIGRIWQGLWLVCGIAVLAYVTSSVTSVMTTLSLTNQIHSVADLPGRPVGAEAGSISEKYAQDLGLDVRLFPDIHEAVRAMLAGEIAAIVGDAPVLEYYAHTHPQQPVAVVGPIFAPDKYGFALPHGSALTRPLTVELIGAHESGRIAEIREKYFGNDP